MPSQSLKSPEWLILGFQGLTGLVILGLMGVGGFFYAIAVGTWLSDGYDFRGWDNLDWLIGLFGAGLISSGLLIAGLLFRFSRWKTAAFLNLGLAVLSAGFVLFSFTMLRAPFIVDAWDEELLLLATAIAGLLILALPPFMLWYRSPARRTLA
jgi:hypothetical protein